MEEGRGCLTSVPTEKLQVLLGDPLGAPYLRVTPGEHLPLPSPLTSIVQGLPLPEPPWGPVDKTGREMEWPNHAGQSMGLRAQQAGDWPCL